MSRKQDTFPQKTETVIWNTKNSIENVKGSQIKGLNTRIKVTTGVGKPIHPHMVEKKHIHESRGRCKKGPKKGT